MSTERRMCPECGTGFDVLTSSKQRYCTPGCQRVASERRRLKRLYGDTDPHAKRECKHCGKEFKPKGEKHEFCSRGCRVKYKRATAKEAAQRYKGRMEAVCMACGRSFIRTSTRQIYCSDKCRRSGRLMRVHPVDVRDPYATGLRVPGLGMVNSCPEACPMEPYADSWVDW